MESRGNAYVNSESDFFSLSSGSLVFAIDMVRMKITEKPLYRRKFT